MFILLLLASYANFLPALSSPILGPRNAHEIQTTNWVSAPATRGTFELLSSCILTLFLCLWSSLHLNIPHKDETAMGQVGRKLLYTLLALFAPELIVLTAWLQHSSATILVTQVNEALEKEGRTDRWTIVHGFYAGMGGFVVDLDNSFIRNQPTPFRATLTASGIAFLAKCGHFPPHISKEFIEDKSKADDLAKLLVCVQVMWCLLQNIGRAASHLPVTLLEVNTLGHALCALAIYRCWWSKPFGIKHPYVLPETSVPPTLRAYMWMCSEVSKKTLADHQKSHEWKYLGFSRGGANDSDQSADDLSTTVHPINDQPVKLREGQDLPGTCFHLNDRLFEPGSHLRFPFLWRKYRVERPDTYLLQREDVRRWRLANEAISQYGEPPEIDEFLVTKVHNHPFDNYSGQLEDDDSFYRFSLVLGLVSAAYGGLHATEWNGFFPTQVERYMWRVSAVVVPAGAIGMMLGIIIDWDLIGDALSKVFEPLFDKADADLVRVEDRLLCNLSNIFIILSRILRVLLILLLGVTVIAVFAIFLAYVFCRMFLVADAFISIRELPLDAYRTPEWTQLLPHL